MSNSSYLCKLYVGSSLRLCNGRAFFQTAYTILNKTETSLIRPYSITFIIIILPSPLSLSCCCCSSVSNLTKASKIHHTNLLSFLHIFKEFPISIQTVCNCSLPRCSTYNKWIVEIFIILLELLLVYQQYSLLDSLL